jgi:hypothetical protein
VCLEVAICPARPRLVVEHETRVGYAFFDVSRMNFDYWRGNTSVATYELMIRMFEK